MAILVARSLSPKFRRLVLKDKVDAALLETLASYLDSGCIIEQHYIKVAPPEGLQEMCQEIVAHIDANGLPTTYVPAADPELQIDVVPGRAMRRRAQTHK